MSFFRFSFYHFLILILIGSVSCRKLKQKEKLQFKNGAVSSAHPLASEVGVEILKKGGNAFDAAIATQFALAACFPNAGNLAGGGFMLARTSDGEYHFLDFRETAPALAERDMYLDEDGQVIEKASTLGALAAGVPGTVDGLWKAHQRFGSMGWKKLVQASIAIAQGYEMSFREAYLANKYAKELLGQNGDDFFLVKPGGKWMVGDSVFNPDLAGSLTQIRDSGRAGFYEGSLAKTLVNGIQKRGGIITMEDLKGYESVWREPMVFPYKEYSVISAPLPSSGGLGLLGILSMLERKPIAEWGPLSSTTIHYIAEAEKIFYHQRSIGLGDPDHNEIPDHFYSKEYYQQRAQKITPYARPGSDFTKAATKPHDETETTHLVVADSMGNIVNLTITLNGLYGSKLCIPGTGFFLNSEMDDFSIKPGIANQFGLTGNRANSIAPGKRMLSSMTPTIVEKDGVPVLAVGSPGGSTIITTVLQVIINVLEFNMPIKEAVDQPRFHHQWLPDSLQVERSAIYISDSLELVRRGHVFKLREHLGRVNALEFRDGLIFGGPDRRWDNTAIGY